jgi:hypothetical protein
MIDQWFEFPTRGSGMGEHGEEEMPKEEATHCEAGGVRFWLWCMTALCLREGDDDGNQEWVSVGIRGGVKL